MNRITLHVLFLLIFVIQATAQTNLMTNGSFENYSPPCPGVSPNGALTQVFDWHAANFIPGVGVPHAELYCNTPNYGNCLPGPVPNVGSDGIAYVGFHTRIFTPFYNESIYQILSAPLTAGNMYRISFDLMNCQSGLFTTGPSDFCVYSNIDTIIPGCPTDNPSVTLLGCAPYDSISNVAWKNHSFTFIAPPNSNIIAFSGAACNVSEIYYYLDNIILTAETVTAMFVADNHVCPGTCTDFTNLSTNATTYQWFFPGGTPATSTDEHPAGICYTTPGNYDVTLIASNATGSDTTMLPNYINVYPYSPSQSIIQNGDTLISNTGFVSYQWFYGGDTISGATDYYYVATQSGDYSVVCLDNNGCSVEAVVLNVVASIQSSLDNERPIIVYPNPVIDKFTIHNSRFTIKTAASISIYNIVGEIVFSAVDCKLSTVDCILFPSGMYYLVISDDKKTMRTKFIKK